MTPKELLEKYVLSKTIRKIDKELLKQYYNENCMVAYGKFKGKNCFEDKISKLNDLLELNCKKKIMPKKRITELSEGLIKSLDKNRLQKLKTKIIVIIKTTQGYSVYNFFVSGKKIEAIVITTLKDALAQMENKKVNILNKKEYEKAIKTAMLEELRK